MKRTISLRLNEIIFLRSKGYTLQRIGELVGITRERVRQILQKAHYSDHVYSPSTWVSRTELARAAGVDPYKIDKLIMVAKLPPIYMGKLPRYELGGVEAIKKANTCRICGRQIPKRRLIYCSRKCMYEACKYINLSLEQKQRRGETMRRWYERNPEKYKAMIQRAGKTYRAKRRQGTTYAVKSGGKGILQEEIVENAGQKVGNRIPVKWHGQVYYIAWGNLRKVNIPTRTSDK